MGVLKVNVGDAVTPDWRNIGCGGSAAATTASMPWGWLTQPVVDGGAAQTITFQAASDPGSYYAVYVNYAWVNPDASAGSASAGVPYPGSSTAVHSLTLSSIPAGANLTSVDVLFYDTGATYTTVLTWTAPTTGRLKLNIGTAEAPVWVREVCDDDTTVETFTDDFNRADGAVGNGWTRWTGSGIYDLSIVGNQIQHTTPGTAVGLQNLADSDLAVEATITLVSGAGGVSFMLLRTSGTTTSTSGVVVSVTRTAVQSEYNDGSNWIPASDTIPDIGTTTTAVRIELVKDSGGTLTISVYVGGVLRHSRTDSTVATGPHTGFYLGGPSGKTITVDDFSADYSIPVVGHPLKVWDGTAWQTAACMTPV